MALRITHSQGNQLLQFVATGVRMPAQLNKKDVEEFDPAQRSLADEEIRKARELLVKHSEMWALKRKVLFGKASNWTEGKDEKGRESWFLIDPEIEVELKPTDDEERGIFWILLLMAHPGGPVKAGIEGMNEVVWPLAEQMGYRNDLRDMTGLSQRKPVRQLRKDSDPSWAKEKKAADKTVDLGDPKPAEVAKA